MGKLLGPKGNSMKRLQEETMTKMAVLGRGSMRDKQKVRFSYISFPLFLKDIKRSAYTTPQQRMVNENFDMAIHIFGFQVTIYYHYFKCFHAAVLSVFPFCEESYVHNSCLV